MKNVTSVILYLVAAAACIAAGMLIGPGLRSAYAMLLPGPAYTLGDFRALHGDVGASVVLFSTSTCPHCRQAREFLEHAHVAYRDFVLDQSPEARQRFAALDGNVVPLLLVGDRRIVGFREEALRDALASIAPQPARTP